MTDTAFGRPSSERLMRIHHRLPDGRLRLGNLGRPDKPELESGGGGLYSTAPDYLNFLAMLLRGGDAGAAAGDRGADGPQPDRRPRH